MNTAVIRQQLAHTLRETSFTDLGEHYRGKVRDTYRHDGRLILVTSDRISAFDHVLRQTIPFKGQVLNQLAAYLFEDTRDIVPADVIAPAARSRAITNLTQTFNAVSKSVASKG